MPFLRLPHLAWALPALLLMITASACGGGDNDGVEVTPTDAPTPTPFSLGTSVTIGGQEVPLPAGVVYMNQSAECQQEETALSDACLNDLKMLVRGNSYILFDPAAARVIARRIEPEDESDFRPLLAIIAGNTGSVTPSESPTS